MKQTENILNEVLEERKKQIKKWGIQNHPALDQTLINRDGSCTPERMCEEYEIPSENRAKFLCKLAFDKQEGTFAHILIEELSEAISAFDSKEQRKELIQVAAVAIAWIEKIDREKN